MSGTMMLYDRDFRLLTTLDGAMGVGYDLPYQDLWTGTFTLAQGDPDNDACQVLRYVRMTDGARDLGLYRIISIDGTVSEGGEIAYALEHAIATLLDDVFFGSFSQEGTVPELIGALLDKQTARRWVLGDCGFADVTMRVTLQEHETLLSGIRQICGQLPDWDWSFDTSALPWRLNIRQADRDSGCGIHYARNLVGVQKTVDGSTMVTRLYLRGAYAAGGYVSVRELTGGLDYIEAPGATGVKCGVYENPRLKTPEELLAKGQQVLAKVSAPYVTYTASALDLYELTGDDWDRFMPGKMVRVMDDEHGVHIDARIVEVAKGDLYGDPGSVEITIASAPRDLLSDLQEISQGVADIDSRVTEADTRLLEQKETLDRQEKKQEATDKKVDQHETDLDAQRKALEEQIQKLLDYAKELEAQQKALKEQRKELADQQKALEDQQKAITDQGTTIAGQVTQLSGIESRMQDAEGNVSVLQQTATDITARVLGAEGDVAQLKVTAASIEGRVNDAEGNIGSLQVTAQDVTARVSTAEGNIGQLQVTASSIEGRVQSAEGDVAQLRVTAEGLRTDVNKKVDDTVYQSYIQQTATAINAKVSGGDIASSFSMTGGDITLFSKTINLDGYVRAKAIESVKVDADELLAGNVSYGTLSGGMLYPTGISADGDVFGESLSTSGAINCQGTTFGPHTMTVGGSSWTILGDSDINFSIADTQEYKSGVSAAEASGWNRGGATCTLNHTGTISLGYGESLTVVPQYTNHNGFTVNNTVGNNYAVIKAPAAPDAQNLRGEPVYDASAHLYTVWCAGDLSSGGSFAWNFNTGTEAYDAGRNSVSVSSHSVSQVGPDRVITIKLSNGNVYSYEV